MKMHIKIFRGVDSEDVTGFFELPEALELIQKMIDPNRIEFSVSVTIAPDANEESYLSFVVVKNGSMFYSIMEKNGDRRRTDQVTFDWEKCSLAISGYFEGDSSWEPNHDFKTIQANPVPEEVRIEIQAKVDQARQNYEEGRVALPYKWIVLALAVICLIAYLIVRRST